MDRGLSISMLLIVTSKEDEASATQSKELLRLADWEEVGHFEGEPCYALQEKRVLTIRGVHLYRDNLDKECERLFGELPSAVVYLSKHRSESGQRSITVHPIGNFGRAEFGGKDNSLVPPATDLMSQYLRAMRGGGEKLGYSVTFEATHHGPYLETPTLYVEMGSSLSEWTDERAGSLIARTVLETRPANLPVFLGIGGGHYVPRLTDIGLAYQVNFAHLVPSYALDDVGERALEEALSKSFGVQYAYVHRKALAKSAARKIEAWLDDRGVKVLEEEDVQRICDEGSGSGSSN